MSTKDERDRLAAMALAEWEAVVEILAERGEIWPHTDSLRWGPGLTATMERVKALVQACAVIGAHDAADLGRLADLYERTHTVD